MRNDFFKYLLLNGSSQADKKELESETLPYAFKSNGHRLRNYRIYGNTGGVGDIDAESGKYIIPVIVYGQTENLVSVDEPLRKIGNAFDYVDFKQQKLYQKIYCKILTGNETWIRESEKAVFRTGLERKELYQDYTSTEYTAQNSYNNLLLNDKSFYIGPTAIIIHDESYAAETKEQSVALFVAALKTKYLSNQPVKIYYSDAATEKTVLLPAIPTIDGKNIISVGTTVQPSKIYLQGNISEIEIVSAEPVQTNVQSLQPLSLDENAELEPSDKNEFQINDISEVPVEDENSIEEILETENLETTGDEENAE